MPRLFTISRNLFVTLTFTVSVALGAAGDISEMRERVSVRWPEPVQCAAIRQLIAQDQHAADFLGSRWLELTPGVRRCAARELVSFNGNRDSFVAAMADGRIPAWTLTEREQRALIAGTKADSLRQSAAAVLASRVALSLELQVRYRAAVDPRGNASAGRATYDNLCVNCHSAHGSHGINLGPPISHLRTLAPHRLVTDIAFPSHTIHPDYERYVIERTSGPAEVVMLAGQTEMALRFRRQTGEVFDVRRQDLARASVVPQSAMPAGLAELLDVDQMADLVTFIVTPER